MLQLWFESRNGGRWGNDVEQKVLAEFVLAAYNRYK
jgi:hypothetical protein